MLSCDLHTQTNKYKFKKSNLKNLHKTDSIEANTLWGSHTNCVGLELATLLPQPVCWLG